MSKFEKIIKLDKLDFKDATLLLRILRNDLNNHRKLTKKLSG